MQEFTLFRVSLLREFTEYSISWECTSSNIRFGLGTPDTFFRLLWSLMALRCCPPVVSWFMATMAFEGCCPPSSSMENRSRGAEHIFVNVRTCQEEKMSHTLVPGMPNQSATILHCTALNEINCKSYSNLNIGLLNLPKPFSRYPVPGHSKSSI